MNPEVRKRRLQTVITLVRDQEYPYEERPEKKIDWPRYDQAQVNEACDVLELIRDLVDHARERVAHPEPPRRRRGRPKTSPYDIAKVVLAQAYHGASNRVAQGYERLFREKLGISADFSYKTIERAYERNDVARVLDTVFVLTNEPVRHLETIFSVDGSGFSTNVRVHYASQRASQRRKSKSVSDVWPGSQHDYVFNTAIIGVEYKVLAAWKPNTDHDVGEHALFAPAMDQFQAMGHDLEYMLGDGIYGTRPCCELVANAGGKPRFMPRRNATFKAHGVAAWPRMLCDLLDNIQQWLETYHLRSISETGFSVIHGLFPQPLRKRRDARKETESYVRAIVYNIRRLAYLTHLIALHPLPPLDQE